MATIYEIESDFGYATEVTLPTLGNVYATANGLEFPLHSDHGWCARCDALICCEATRTTHEGRNIGHEWLLLELSMFQQRTSPPRCLECAGIDLTRPDGAGLFRLPDERCLSLSIVGFALIVGTFGVYSFEGIRICDTRSNDLS